MPNRILLSLSVLLLLAAPIPAAAYDVQTGIGFVALRGLVEGAEVEISEPSGGVIETGVVDRFGSVLFRELGEGKTYALAEVGSAAPPTLATTRVFVEHPDLSFYEAQTLVDGFQYIQMRDGTLLSAMVRPPLGMTMAQGPFPTLVEYSGYDPSNSESQEPSSLLAWALGYATVGVNMRGSGCSGGVFDLFDLPTTADGYDVVEVVAAQSWVAGGKVGMIGISFSGISQVYVGGAEPPHLAAVAPLSVISDIFRFPGFPGGIRNSGFAESWLQDRKNDAEPAPEGGQGWARRRVNNGDAVCLDNQKLRLQTLDPIEFTAVEPYYVPELMDPRSPATWISQIEVPIFLGGTWQDEQTGAGFTTMLPKLPRGRDVKVSLLNGVHSSTLEPEILYEWIAFLDIYVAETLPDPGRSAPFASVIAAEILGPGAPTPPLPVDRYDGFTNLTAARKAFEAQPRFRVLLENGAGSPTAGLPAPTFELGFETWPPREKKHTRWYFGPNGTLTPRRPSRAASGVDSYRPDPAARPQQTLPGSGAADSWKVMPPYNWQPLLGDTAVAYATPPLTEDITIVGPSSVDLWLRSDAADTDIQVTLSEIRPDGLETYVQSGWLRASHRREDRRRRTRLQPWHTHLEEHSMPMPEGEFERVRIALLAVGHVFRRDSRIRISLEAPGGDRTRWRFDTPATGGAVVNEVSRTRARPSRLMLPVIRNVDPPEPRPPGRSLRGQPSRTYVPASNGG
ncbi:MAG: CocE/NonD family hydrolase [Candidatus Binatia bacterium]|nr:CocE/NonD family hydrolase [Candidatus Binatia bacterium]